jgi:hypothetical protein
MATGQFHSNPSYPYLRKQFKKRKAEKPKKFQHLGNVGFEHPNFFLSTFFYSKEKHQPPNQKVEFQDILKF